MELTIAREDVSVLVSIVCTTFNHEKYIERALKSFIRQEASFRYEVLVIDTGSTDHTRSIVSQYCEAYPDIISSHFIDFYTYEMWDYILSIAKGDFIAICDGDDYWTDNSKLEIQMRVMQEKGRGCQISFHPAVRENIETGGKDIICKYSDEVSKVGTPMAILGGGKFMPTSSLLVTRAGIEQAYPYIRFTWPAADVTIQVISACIGDGCVYVPRVMSSYTYLHPSSWTKQTGDYGLSHRLYHLLRLSRFYMQAMLHYPQFSFAFLSKLAWILLMIISTVIKHPMRDRLS